MGIFVPILIRMRVENILIGNDEKKTECQAAEDMGPAATAATAAAGMAVIAAATTMAGAEIVFRVFPTAAQPAGLSVV